METVKLDWATCFIPWHPESDDFLFPSALYVAFWFHLVSIISHVPCCKGHCSIFLLILSEGCYYTHLKVKSSSPKIFFSFLNYSIFSCCQSKLNYRKSLSWANLPADQEWEPSKNNRPVCQLSRGGRAKCLR